MKTSDICGLVIVSLVLTVMVILCVFASIDLPEIETEAIPIILFEDPDEIAQNDTFETEPDASPLSEKLDGIQTFKFPQE
jgi:hypothetical protein